MFRQLVPNMNALLLWSFLLVFLALFSRCFKSEIFISESEILEFLSQLIDFKIFHRGFQTDGNIILSVAS